jgi:DNA replication protein DnaC
MEKMQKETCDAVLKGHNVLIRGQGGTGKSFLLNIIKKELTKLGKSVSITSSTGVASLNVGRDYYPRMVWYWRWPFLK